jgi:hypothetical protein
MAAEKFREAEDAYLRLRTQFDIGHITPQQFDEKLREQMVQDASGRYWMLGADSGEWYVYDGDRWVTGEPPGRAADAPLTYESIRTLPGTVPSKGRELFYNPPVRIAPPKERRAILVVPLLIGLILGAIGLGVLLQNPNPIFVAEPPPTQIAPILLPTRTHVLAAQKLEPDLLNTPTPFPTPLIPPSVMPAGEPTAPLAVVIPTITPFVPPPPTSALSGRRRMGNGPDARARYLPISQFILDGDLNEWGGEGIPLTLPHFGVDQWRGPADLSGTAWVGWNENGLLLAVNVLDDTHVQTQRSWEMFRGDSVELWMDAELEGDFDVATANGDDYQFGFSPGNFADLPPEGVVYVPSRDATLNRQILVAARTHSAGYTLESAVPWAVLRVQPQQGRVFGYGVDLSDNDVPGTAQQQTQVNHNPNFQFQMPATFGNLVLE